MADEHLRRLLRKYVTANGTLPQHIRERYKLCQCLNRYCEHCLSQEEIADTPDPSKDPARFIGKGIRKCLQGAALTIYLRMRPSGRELSLKLCRSCAESYFKSAGRSTGPDDPSDGWYTKD